MVHPGWPGGANPPPPIPSLAHLPAAASCLAPLCSCLRQPHCQLRPPPLLPPLPLPPRPQLPRKSGTLRRLLSLSCGGRRRRWQGCAPGPFGPAPPGHRPSPAPENIINDPHYNTTLIGLHCGPLALPKLTVPCRDRHLLHCRQSALHCVPLNAAVRCSRKTGRQALSGCVKNQRMPKTSMSHNWCLGPDCLGSTKIPSCHDQRLSNDLLIFEKPRLEVQSPHQGSQEQAPGDTVVLFRMV